MAERFGRLLKISLEVAWAAVILLLPITSLPLISKLAGGTMVAPASLIPLAWLGLVWFATYLVKRGRLPRESLPLLFFVSVAICASAVAFFLNIPPFKNRSITSEEIGAVVTVMIGLAFYLVTASWLSQSSARLKRTLQYLNIGGAVMILWTLVQAYYIYFFNSEYPEVISTIQHLFSIQGLYDRRMTGMAFEPSWLANQLNMIYLPFWLAATITGWSAFRFRLWKFSFENILLAIGVAILVMTSRVGMLSFMLVAAFLGIYINIVLAKRIRTWSQKRMERLSPIVKRVATSLLPVVILLTFACIYLVGTVALVYGISRLDWRLARIFEVSSLEHLQAITANPYTIFNYLAFAERVVFWQAGWNVFNLHPIFGVGLGNAGFYFPETLPSFGWYLPELMNYLYRASSLPNIKSIWVRLLAETGIVGFSAFVTWLYVVLRSSWPMRLVQKSVFKTIGWAGVLVLVAFIFEGFSVDTFALPYLWVSLGIVSAAAMLMRREEAAVE